MPDHSRLRRIARDLARGRAIEWESEEGAAESESERLEIHDLRLIAALSAFHRESQAGGFERDLSASVSIARDEAGLAGGIEGAPGDEGDAGVPPDPASVSLAPGSRWGHLEIIELTGRGAFGEVYRARDTRLDRVVALKLLSGETAGQSDEVIREARILARVAHPNVVTVYGADRIAGRVGIWMEFLQGETLEKSLRARGPLDAREAALIGIDLCRALSAVHGEGICHQDLKLANVMRAQRGRIVLMDFGLGREMDPDRAARGRRSLSGTPLFMAPEVLRGERAEARSDIYSLGVVLFALVTGSMPVTASTLSELRARHRRGESRHARDLRPDLSEDFAQILERMLSPDPGQRFASAHEVERALLLALGTAARGPAPEAVQVRPRVFIGLAAIALVALAAGAWWLSQGRRAAAPLPSPPFFSDTPTQSLYGDDPHEMFGLALACVGDVDQDGHDDVLIAAPNYSKGMPSAGKIFLYRGNASGLEAQPVWTATGETADARLGWSVASLTNLSFDGYPDLVVGAPGLETIPSPPGGVVIYRILNGTLPPKPTQILHDGGPGTLFGCSISTGDVDHDGFDDLLVGEPGYPDPSVNAGRALLYRANNGAYIERPIWTAKGPPGSRFGLSVDMSGDLNNDGYRDAVIGALTASFGPSEVEAGAAYVYLGSATGLDTIPVVIPGRHPGAQSGRGVLIAGDLDGDGCADLLVGAEGASDGEEGEGVVEIHFGSKAGVSPYSTLILEPNVSGANFGGHLAALGDLDGDGRADFFAGALRYQRTEPREGAAYVFGCSPEREPRRLWFRVGGKAGSWYGTAAASADVNGDRRRDLLISAPAWDNETGIDVGRVDLFLGRR